MPEQPQEYKAKSFDYRVGWWGIILDLRSYSTDIDRSFRIETLYSQIQKIQEERGLNDLCDGAIAAMRLYEKTGHLPEPDGS